MFKNTMALCFLLFFAAGTNSWAADSTSFDPLPVSVKSQSAIPVGTVITWPAASHPNDSQNWLECNGQGISSAVYPELFSIVGSTVPNYTGMFLRGVGGSSASLGTVQGYAMKDSNTLSGQFESFGTGQANGAVSLAWAGPSAVSAGVPVGLYHTVYNINMMSDIPKADEIRPINTAVRYLIRARP